MIESLGNLIVILFELCIVLLLLDGIMYMLGQMFSISWKKLLIGSSLMFIFLWLRDHFKSSNTNNVLETEETVVDNETNMEE